MAFQPSTFAPQRKSRTFNALNPNAFISPFYFMVAATTGVAGMVMQYSSTQESTVIIATSGMQSYQLAGFLMQDVKDLDSGAVRGYRNLNNTTANLGENVGILQSDGPVETAQYNGSPTLGQRLCVNDGTGNLSVYTALMAGSDIAVVEATVESNPTSLEPAQFAAGGRPNQIRLRIYGF